MELVPLLEFPEGMVFCTDFSKWEHHHHQHMPTILVTNCRLVVNLYTSTNLGFIQGKRNTILPPLKPEAGPCSPVFYEVWVCVYVCACLHLFVCVRAPQQQTGRRGRSEEALRTPNILPTEEIAKEGNWSSGQPL